MCAALRPVAVSLQVTPPVASGPRFSRPLISSGSVDTFEVEARAPQASLRHPLSRQLNAAQFERVYHQNQWPSLGRFRGLTGAIPEHRVWLNTQKGQPFSTALINISTVSGHWAVVPLLAGALVFSGIFGMRKGYHQAVSNWRANRMAQRPMPPEEALSASVEMQFERGCGLKALAKLRSQERWRARVGMLTVGGLAPLAATMTTVDIFFKPPILGHLVPALAAAAHPLAVASLPVLAGSAFFAGAFDLVGVWRMGALHRRLQEATLEPWLGGLEDQVLDMARQRMGEVRKYGLYSGMASMGVALGAPLCFAFGPAGLSVLLPSILATIWIGYERSNRTEYKATLSDEQKLALGNKHDLCNEVQRAHQHYAALKALKAERRIYYPYGADSPVGYATRLWAWARRTRWAPPERPRWETARESVLQYWDTQLDIETDFARRRLILVQQEMARPISDVRMAELENQQSSAMRMVRQTDGMRAVAQDVAAGRLGAAEVVDHLHALMEDTGLLHAFGAQLLGDRALRRLFEQRGFEHRGRRWSVDPERIEDTVERELDAGDQEFILERYWCHAEQVLLQRGKRRYRDRMRELLDYFTIALDVENCGR